MKSVDKEKMSPEELEELLEINIRKKEVNFLVWLIPVISIFVAGWLIFKYYSNLGPLIEIEFKNSGGLEPKHSIVKFRDVKVGVVEKVNILKNKEGVLVFVRMHKDMKPFLNLTTKFWIVKPRIGIGEVRGLDALLNGPYIQMYAKPIDFTKDKFKGLDEPPLDSNILNGKIITLFANNTYGLSDKLPVYYKQLRVGTIRKIELLKNKKFKIIISIQKKYAFLINSSTKFWNLKKINISLKDNNLKVALPGLKEMLFGGISFDTPFDVNKTKKEFKLYASKSDAFKNRLGKFHKYIYVKIKLINNNNSLLNIGDMVKFKGFNVGFIKNIDSHYDLKNKQIISDVLVKLDLGAFNAKDIKSLLNKGLKAYINNPIPLINNAYISFMFDNKKDNLKTDNGVYFIPMIKKKNISLMVKLNKFLDKLNSLPLKKSIQNVNNLIKTTTPNLNKMLKSITKTSDSTRALLDENNKNIKLTFKNINKLSQNLNSLIKSYNKDSMFYERSSKTLNDLDKTLLNINKFIDKLDKKPNALIFGD